MIAPNIQPRFLLAYISYWWFTFNIFFSLFVHRIHRVKLHSRSAESPRDFIVGRLDDGRLNQRQTLRN